jgi:hypothetical protein
MKNVIYLFIALFIFSVSPANAAGTIGIIGASADNGCEAEAPTMYCLYGGMYLSLSQALTANSNYNILTAANAGDFITKDAPSDVGRGQGLGFESQWWKIWTESMGSDYTTTSLRALVIDVSKECSMPSLGYICDQTALNNINVTINRIIGYVNTYIRNASGNNRNPNFKVFVFGYPTYQYFANSQVNWYNSDWSANAASRGAMYFAPWANATPGTDLIHPTYSSMLNSALLVKSYLDTYVTL